MVWKGLKFGMLLQLAVGPMCLLVFSTSTTKGFFTGITLVLAIALIDAFYITLSGLGVAALIGKGRTKYVIKIFGGIVLILFGLQYILGIFHLTILPNINILSHISNQSVFLQGLLLTASNPLTIIFWSGVFTTQLIEHELTKKQLFLFGIGCVLSTLFFLTGIAALGNIISGFLPAIIISLLNGAVGLIIMFFGIKMSLRQ